MQETYMLRYPFRPLHWITGLETEYQFVVNGLQCSLQGEKPHLVIRVQPFSTVQEALAYIPHLWGALAQISVELGTGFISESHSVVPIGLNILAPMDIEATGKALYSVDKYMPPFIKALGQTKIDGLYEDEKLRTAIELWSDAQRENSLRSKLLTCVTALEVLSEPEPKHKIAQLLLDNLDEEIIDQIKVFPEDSEEYHGLESLQRELTFRRKSSLRSSIRRLILASLTNLPEDERLERSRDVVWSYDIRGSLIHDGKVLPADLDRAHEIAQNALRDVLANKIRIMYS